MEVMRHCLSWVGGGNFRELSRIFRGDDARQDRPRHAGHIRPAPGPAAQGAGAERCRKKQARAGQVRVTVTIPAGRRDELLVFVAALRDET
jgi:hypothetical protein